MTDERVPENMRHANLAQALAAFQAEVPKVEKGATAKVETKTGGTYTYAYADLAVVTAIGMPKLGSHGLSFSAKPTMIGGAFVLHYKLSHESGETDEGLYPLPDPTGAKPQEIGSAITYARRYSFCAVTGLAPGDDDDDAAAANGKPAAASKPAAKASARQKPTAEKPQQPSAAPGWGPKILDVDSLDQLRSVHAAVDAAGELQMRFAGEDTRAVEETVKHFGLDEPPVNVTVGQMIGAVKTAIERRPPESGEVLDRDPDQAMWKAAEIPGEGQG